MTSSSFDLVRDYLPYNIPQTVTRVRDISVYYIHPLTAEGIWKWYGPGDYHSTIRAKRVSFFLNFFFYSIAVASYKLVHYNNIYCMMQFNY